MASGAPDPRKAAPRQAPAPTGIAVKALAGEVDAGIVKRGDDAPEYLGLTFTTPGNGKVEILMPVEITEQFIDGIKEVHRDYQEAKRSGLWTPDSDLKTSGGPNGEVSG